MTFHVKPFIHTLLASLHVQHSCSRPYPTPDHFTTSSQTAHDPSRSFHLCGTVLSETWRSCGSSRLFHYLSNLQKSQNGPKEEGGRGEEDRSRSTGQQLEGESSCVEGRFESDRPEIQIGIVGLPNVGKSSFFNTLSQTDLGKAANFPYATM